MRESRHSITFESDLRPSLHWMMVLLVALGLTLVFVSELNPGYPGRVSLLDLGLLLFAVPAVTWLLAQWKPLVARWTMVLSSITVVCLSSYWLDTPSVLILLGIPVAFAAMLLGLAAATAVSAGETVLLAFLPSSAALDVSMSTVAVALIATWATWLIVIAIYQPVHQLGTWLSWYFECAQDMLEAARGRNAEMEQALENLVNANRQLALANERIAALRHIAEEAEKTKTQFVAKVSHEFRTPLNMILGLVNLMVENPRIYAVTLPSEMRDDLRIVRRNCDHLANMINDVLSLSQMDAGRLMLYREQVDLAELVDDAVEVVRPLVEKKELALRIAIPAKLPRIYCDRTRIQQVVLNLVSNAARFTEGGSISVQVERRDTRVVVSVADTGPGVPAEDTERIFEPFYQGSNVLWGDKGGTGLGLAVSRQFVKRHGGRMWLESEVGDGSTFIFELPISEPLEHLKRPGRRIREDWVWREGAFRNQAGIAGQSIKPRVIICDETGGLQPEFVGCTDEVEFIEVRDLTEAAEGLRQCPAHAVVLNARTSDNLGTLIEEAQREIRGTPIIACSMPRRIERALEAGASGYLTKPVTPADLQDAIQGVGRPVRRVLVVDDDADFARLLTRMLRACDDTLEIVIASYGEEALSELRTRSPDLILLDVVLPDMDGWEMLERKNRDRAMRDIPVIFVSGRDVTEGPLITRFLVATMGEGLSVSQVLDCSLEFSALLLNPDGRPDPGRLQRAGDGRASIGSAQPREKAPVLSL